MSPNRFMHIDAWPRPPPLVVVRLWPLKGAFVIPNRCLLTHFLFLRHIPFASPAFGSNTKLLVVAVLAFVSLFWFVGASSGVEALPG
ncbi:hypothetical protein M427DRAFT_52338 [Gonapodya prolifera JEL478]|uniref:Transmembrane protein n=1 Tax=Gonapodya prolifera (strain JEL478) TaxID=1344416 RepID=A0A139ATM2_GONPJ|nr:hypothetical protein M427DRAFT_52338 [Gonapodya prolifera JEL478]|eukprot:KXS20076.1 hypothetical protein M427DRAFT_52338 [Gonapodya prolifera JEL478]